MTETAAKRPKCIGIGRIFGHRFTVSIGQYVYKTPYCGRCGFVPERLLSEQLIPEEGDEHWHWTRWESSR